MLNRFTGVGRLTKDPELQKTSTGISTMKFSIAVTRDRKDSTGNYPADFILCQAWRQTAEFLNRYAQKGTMLAVDGRLETGSYESNGHKVYTWIINCDSVNILSSYGNSQQKSSDPAPADNSSDSYSDYMNDQGIEVDPDDMPF